MSAQHPVAVVTVAGLARYPVKSLQGEDLDELRLEARGAVDDRRWALREPDGRLGSGKSTRRFRAMARLLDLGARLVPGGVEVRLADGRRLTAGAELDAALTAHVGRPVRLAEEDDVPHHDDGPLHLVGAASARALDADPAVCRANLVLATSEAFVEEGWVGRDLLVGTARLRVTGTTERCVMVGRATLARVAAAHDLQLGVYADVVVPGTVRLGDVVEVVPLA